MARRKLVHVKPTLPSNTLTLDLTPYSCSPKGAHLDVNCRAYSSEEGWRIWSADLSADQPYSTRHLSDLQSVVARNNFQWQGRLLSVATVLIHRLAFGSLPLLLTLQPGTIKVRFQHFVQIRTPTIGRPVVPSLAAHPIAKAYHLEIRFDWAWSCTRRLQLGMSVDEEL